MLEANTAKRIINALNRRDKEMLKTELSSLTSLELIVFLQRGYKFLLPDILKVMELPDARPEERSAESNAIILHTHPNPG